MKRIFNIRSTLVMLGALAAMLLAAPQAIAFDDPAPPEIDEIGERLDASEQFANPVGEEAARPPREAIDPSFGPPIAKPEPLYGISGSNKLVRYDVSRAREQIIGDLTYPDVMGLVLDPDTQTMYGLARDGELMAVDADSGTCRPILSLSGGLDILVSYFGLAIEYSEGRRYLCTASEDQFRRVDITESEWRIEEAVSISRNSILGMASSPTTGRVWAVNRAAGNLAIVNGLTGQAVQQLQSIGIANPTGLAFDNVGSLWGTFEDGTLAHYDVMTGIARAFRQTSMKRGLALGPAAALAGCQACPAGTSFFEASTLAGWTGYTGTHYTDAFGFEHTKLSGSGIVSGRHTVMTCPGYDPVVGGQTLRLVNEGRNSIRLGNSGTGSQAERISKQMVVNPSNSLLRFSYAVVLQNPLDHRRAQQPYFTYHVYRRVLGIPVTIAKVSKYADHNDPYFVATGTNDVLYHPWECVELDLQQYMGNKIYLDFTTADCTQGGHFGYAYIDGFCDDLVNPSFTVPSMLCLSANTFPADGTASTGATSYFWSVEESDANWGRNPTTERYQWFVGQPGPLDLKAFFSGLGGVWKCNTYYRVKLAVHNACVNWKESTHLIYVQCPMIDPGPNLTLCQNGTNTYQVQLGTPAIPGYHYSWTPANMFNDPTLAQPIATFVDPRPGAYCATVVFTLTVTDPQGCVATAKVSLSVQGDIFVRITKSDPTSCENAVTTLTGLIGACPSTTGYWTPGGQQTPVIKIPPGTPPQTYTYTAVGPCGTKSASVFVDYMPPMNGLAPTLFYANTIVPTSSNPLVSTFYMSDSNFNCGDHHAYGIVEYDFNVYDRWGNLIWNKHGGGNGCCWGFDNCTLPGWNGRNTQGHYVQEDTYNWTFDYLDTNSCASGIWKRLKDAYGPTGIHYINVIY